MKSTTFKKFICLMLTGMISVGAPIMAAGPVEIRSTDVALVDGIMSGTIVNSAAQPVSGLNLQLLHNDKVIAQATSDENGEFAIRGLRNGGHVLQVGSVQQPVRFCRFHSNDELLLKFLLWSIQILPLHHPIFPICPNLWNKV